MSVSKFYALLKKDKDETVINAYEALRLSNGEYATLVTSPKEAACLYDIETQLKVLPSRGRRKKDNSLGQAYFKYYNDEESPLKGIPSTFEYTPELNVFLKAFDGIKCFKIKEWEGDIIEIFPEKTEKLKRVVTEDSFVILKFYIDLKKTKPYSAYYKYNGVLGLELTVTSRPTPPKMRGLSQLGIPLFNAKAKFPDRLNIPEEFLTEEDYNKVSLELRKVYENTEYILFGKFDNNAITFPEYKEKYEILKHFEEQQEELKNEIQRLEMQKNLEYQELKKIRFAKKEIVLEIKEYTKNKNYYEQIEKNNIRLEQEVKQNKNISDALLSQSKDDNERMKNQLKKITNKYKLSEEKVEELEKRTFFSFISSKIFKK